MKKAIFKMTLSMAIFGTIGIFVRFLPFASGRIAFLRGVIGAAFLLLLKLIKKEPINFKAIKKNILPLCLSGAFIGINWILLFEAYRFTTVSVATLCYYMAPIFVTLLSPVLLKEKLTTKKVICVFTAFIGMIAVSGVLSSGGANLAGAGLGVGAAIFYAAVILTNKKLKEISDDDRTVFQLLTAAAVILPYTLLCENFATEISGAAIVIMLTVGILHTGLTYKLYFGAVAELPAQTTAVLGYIDPVVALLLSALFLSEPLDLTGYIGAALILGSAFISEKQKS